MKKIVLWPVWAIGLFAATSLRGNLIENQQIVDLEAFIVEEAAQTQLETLSPTTVRVEAFFGKSQTVLEIPRSVTVISPELKELLQIDSYEALDKFGAGTQRVNYFGLAGSAFLRGARAGTYFNGMLRAYQRNEMPMSFGSLEGIEIIKGPVPAGFSPTLVGGAVNQRPKSPYFDRARGSVEGGIGSWKERSLNVDYGAPLLLFGKPAAYRLSYSGMRSERFYANVPHDFDSLYGAAKIKLSERNRLFLGGELYDFRSSEVPGINRPTRELIGNRQYVIGEPVPLTSGAWGGTVVRPLLEFPTTLVLNPALFSLAIPGDLARQRIDPALLDRMLNLNDPTVLQSLYTTLPESAVPGFAAWALTPAREFLAEVEQVPVDAYLYTANYLEAGGEVLTTTLPRDRVLADPRDRADSRDVIAFADLETRMEGDNRLLTRFFLEKLQTEKASTYGFALDTDQLVLNAQTEWQHGFADAASHLAIGLDLRYTEATTLQDFDAEPFSRRDLSRPTISDNTRVIAGGQSGPDGLNFWSTFGTASQASQLTQAALYAGGQWQMLERFHWLLGLRLENAWWDISLPQEVDRAGEADRAFRSDRHSTALWQVHLNPHWEVTPGVFLYGAFQMGKALAPGDGGTISGKDSFTDAELFEAGIKTSLLEGKLFSSLSVYHWDQATYSTRDASANPLRAKGLEWELTWSPVENLTLLGAFTAQRVYMRSQTLGFGALPQTEADWALNAGILNATSPRLAPDNPEMVFAGVPELSAHLYAAWQLPGGWQVAAGPIWRDGYYHDMQRALRIPGHVLWTAQIRYQTDRWWIRLHLENLFDKEYWIGQEPVFSASTLILQGQGRSFRLSVGLRF